MTTDTIVVLMIAMAFGIFAGTLYWADLHTRSLINRHASQLHAGAAAPPRSPLPAVRICNGRQQVGRKQCAG